MKGGRKGGKWRFVKFVLGQEFNLDVWENFQSRTHDSITRFVNLSVGWSAVFGLSVFFFSFFLASLPLLNDKYEEFWSTYHMDWLDFYWKGIYLIISFYWSHFFTRCVERCHSKDNLEPLERNWKLLNIKLLSFYTSKGLM